MGRIFQLVVIVMALLVIQTPSIHAMDKQEDEGKHNWVKYSTEFEVIEVGNHEYTYWKNFIKHTRTCQISHRIKTVVYYCELHDHTRSETSLEEVLHSEKHRN